MVVLSSLPLFEFGLIFHPKSLKTVCFCLLNDWFVDCQSPNYNIINTYEDTLFCWMAIGNKYIHDWIEKANVILLDIEGTITSIDFVKKTLFPYAHDIVQSYLESHFDEEVTQRDIASIQALAMARKKEGMDVNLDICNDKQNKNIRISCAVRLIRHWMNCDLKLAPLKLLQGRIWAEGYKSGLLKGHLYPDVLEPLKKLKMQQKCIGIYSSGSVQAQQLLVSYSDFGDLTELFSFHFDTNIGPKQKSSSYSAIAKELCHDPEDIVFFTDLEEGMLQLPFPKQTVISLCIYDEAIASRQAGMHCILVHRPGNAPLSEAAKQDIPIVHSFDQILL